MAGDSGHSALYASTGVQQVQQVRPTVVQRARPMQFPGSQNQATYPSVVSLQGAAAGAPLRADVPSRSTSTTQSIAQALAWPTALVAAAAALVAAFLHRTRNASAAAPLLPRFLKAGASDEVAELREAMGLADQQVKAVAEEKALNKRTAMATLALG